MKHPGGKPQVRRIDQRRLPGSSGQNFARFSRPPESRSDALNLAMGFNPRDPENLRLVASATAESIVADET